MSDPFIDIYEITDCNGDKHRVFPMKLKNRIEVVKLMSKFSDTMVFMNFMNPKINNGEIVRDDNGEIEYDDESANAVLRIAEIATGETQEQLMEWLDVVTIEELVKIFLNIGNLKKKTVAP